MSLHDDLWQICVKRPEDYSPWGNPIYGSRDTDCDCSCGCKFFIPLEGATGADWGICYNPKSHRAGLLTFEHQGCRQFVYDDSPDEEPK